MVQEIGNDMNISSRKYSFMDMSLHLISLGLAVLLWYFVVGEDQVDMNVEIPVEIINLPPTLVISNDFKKKIKVSVRGPRSLAQDLKNKPIFRSVDLADVKVGSFVVENTVESIAFPRLITVLRLQPASIVLLLDELAEKRFPVDPVTVGQVAEGYMLKSLTLKPAAIEVSGPRNILDSIMAMKTSLIYLDGLKQSVERQVRLNLNQALQDLTGEVVVSAAIVVEEILQQRRVENIPIALGPEMAAYKICPETLSVSARIPVNLIRKTGELGKLFQASLAPPSQENQTEFQVVVNVRPQAGHVPIEIVDITPKVVRAQALPPIPAEAAPPPVDSPD